MLLRCRDGLGPTLLKRELAKQHSLARDAEQLARAILGEAERAVRKEHARAHTLHTLQPRAARAHGIPRDAGGSSTLLVCSGVADDEEAAGGEASSSEKRHARAAHGAQIPLCK
eukprot:4513440-Prymnesium_polylepis.1